MSVAPNAPRRINFEFFSIPWVRRVEILIKHHLLREEDDRSCAGFNSAWVRAIESECGVLLAKDINEMYEFYTTYKKETM